MSRARSGGGAEAGPKTSAGNDMLRSWKGATKRSITVIFMDLSASIGCHDLHLLMISFLFSRIGRCTHHKHYPVKVMSTGLGFDKIKFICNIVVFSQRRSAINEHRVLHFLHELENQPLLMEGIIANLQMGQCRIQRLAQAAKRTALPSELQHYADFSG